MQLVKDHINILLPLTVIFAMTSRFMDDLRFLYYPTPVLLLLFIISGYDEILKNKNFRTYILLFLLFSVWAMLTSLWSDYPLVSLKRGAYFTLLGLGGGLGAALWRRSEAFKKNPFGFLLPANILVLVLSSVSLIIGWPEDAWTGGNGVGFMGIFGLQLSLSIVLLASFPAPLYLLLKLISRSELLKRENKTESVIVLLIISLNMFFVVISHSRAALLSMVAALFISLFLVFSSKQRLYLFGVSVAAVIIILSFSPFSQLAESYALKKTSHLTSNRDILWKPSLEAAKIGGLFGVGYGISVPDLETPFRNTNLKGTRIIREKGNSILGLVEEVGLIGLILFISFMGFAYKTLLLEHKLVRSRSTNLFFIVNVSILIAFFIHIQFEAWWVGMTEPPLIIFLMLLGLTVSIMNKTDLPRAKIE